ncbi:MAG: integration host factor subunit beta [Bacteroidetes bacterium]|nr:integration host factor subunit beta [Bacteroidota bacterium]MBS1629744.1 integration host factor subunit beta [Bacteroidota bacterium]
MTKADIINKISEKTGVPKVDVLVTVEAFFKEVKGALEEGEPVHVRGFGSFLLKRRAAKTARNIRQNTAVQIPEHTIPAFKPSVEFANLVRDIVVDKEKHNSQSGGAS